MKVSQRQVVVALASWHDMKDGLAVPSPEWQAWDEVNQEIIARFGHGGFRRIRRAAWSLRAEQEASA